MALYQDSLNIKNTLVTNKCDEGFLSGANTRIRTGDLILTKDVLCRLSYSSIGRGRRDRTLGLRFWRPSLCQLSYRPIICTFSNYLLLYVYVSDCSYNLSSFLVSFHPENPYTQPTHQMHLGIFSSRYQLLDNISLHH